MGVVSPFGLGIDATRTALVEGRRCLRPLSLFPVAKGPPLPVGEITISMENEALPRTHQLARIAAAQAMAGSPKPPDAIVMGVTTGGMSTTEIHLKTVARNPDLFSHHGVGSVAEDIAAIYHCKGPVITVSTACSSGGAALKIALEMMRARKAGRILVGGADSLCRLTYYGFLSLQLIDPKGARPFDEGRRGMSIAEGAAMLLLVADQPGQAVGEILGGGLSCDAYHPTAPHPEGSGALVAMREAIADAGIDPGDIDYINLHGTGTIDNDRSEAKAIRTLFGPAPPLLSSIKGACGHSLAAAGAVEAVVAAIAIAADLVPASTGCGSPDPDLGIVPVQKPLQRPMETVLSNSFGFGGNNASVVIGRPGRASRFMDSSPRTRTMSIIGSACITGQGGTEMTMAALGRGTACNGRSSLETLALQLPPSEIRRLKRLPRLAMSLALEAHRDSDQSRRPLSVFFGTGWGALSETHDFLTRLNETGEQFPSPTDFVGSVHNAPAGRIAMWFKAQGPSITTTGGNYSFEQSLLAADLCASEGNDCFLVIGADEAHPELSPLFDRSVIPGHVLSDGGGALLIRRAELASAFRVQLLFYENVRENPEVIPALLDALGGRNHMRERYGFILAGIPAAERTVGERQLGDLLSRSAFPNSVLDYRKWTGEFASASAVAVVMAVKFLEAGLFPGVLCAGADVDLRRKGGLVIGLGRFVTAMEIMPG